MFVAAPVAIALILLVVGWQAAVMNERGAWWGRPPLPAAPVPIADLPRPTDPMGRLVDALRRRRWASDLRFCPKALTNLPSLL